jgi:hypothetical protein
MAAREKRVNATPSLTATAKGLAMTAPNELTGQTFSGIEVLGRGPNNPKGNCRWRCQCPCGAEFLALGYSLKRGKTKSCGCRQSFVRHGMSHHSLYTVWAGLHQRCGNQNCAEYANYGGRGITVCEEWRDPVPFLAWAQDSGWRKGLHLDRIDNDGPYAPGNCRFVSHRTNCNNRRNTVFLEWQGQTWPLADLARKYGLRPSILHSRLYEVKMPLEMALTLPVDRQRVKKIMRQWRADL